MKPRSIAPLFAALPLAVTPALAALWTPSEISTIGWYDASEAANVVTSGTNVTAWNDISGNGYHLNTVAGGSPDYDGSQINGLNAINLGSTFDELYRAGIPSINLNQVTVISVGMPQLAGDYPNLGSVYSTDLTDKLYLRLQNNDVSGKISTALKVDGINASLSSTNNTMIRDNVPVMFAAYYDGFDAVSRVNGGAILATNAAAPDGATFTINEIQIGRDSGTPRNLHGEMVVLGTADLATIGLVEGYLAWKWGTQASLPTDHTYYSAAPTVIPEPSSIALLGLGSIGLLLRRCRKQRA